MTRQAKIHYRKITKLIECFCLDIDATRTTALVHVNRKTTNRYFMLFRLAIYWHQVKEKNKVIGEAECDESYFGAKRKRGFRGKLKRGRGTQKQPVFGVFERDGRVFTEIVPDCKKKTLQALILGKISSDTVIYTDGWRGYNGLVDVGYDRHFRVNHGKNEFSKGNGVHINGIESFWSFTKRRLNKFNGVKKNFNLHLKECEWRWKKKPKQLEKELRQILRHYVNI
ncbi:MAG: IS1595 family transposase [Parcubacteria group bacterium]|nr:IS1595 family transposase [Parcubacteria group bacterium]